MGELPIFSSKAHVFTIDPKTKKTWIQSSFTAVEINYFVDPIKDCFRIVSIEDLSEGKKVILNSTLTEKMTFKKTSQKFGQFTDYNQGTIFGLGFNSEAELDLFANKFKECIESMRNKVNHVVQGDNCSNKFVRRELPNVNINLLEFPDNDRPALSPRCTSPNANNSRSKVAFLEGELERLHQMHEDLQRQHQIEIQQLKRELDHSNTGMLVNTVENYQCVNELQLKVKELEQENMELTKKVSDLDYSEFQNSFNKQLPEIIELHDKMETIITRLTSCHLLIGQKISDIASAQSSTYFITNNAGLSANHGLI